MQKPRSCPSPAEWEPYLNRLIGMHIAVWEAVLEYLLSQNSSTLDPVIRNFSFIVRDNVQTNQMKKNLMTRVKKCYLNSNMPSTPFVCWVLLLLLRTPTSYAMISSKTDLWRVPARHHPWETSPLWFFPVRHHLYRLSPASLSPKPRDRWWWKTNTWSQFNIQAALSSRGALSTWLSLPLL